jgi:hypothetical protein
MAKGTALFDTVAIAGSIAGVRWGRGGGARWADALSGRVSADGVPSRGQQHDCFGSAQKGGVVLMLDGNVTFKNGTISKSKAVRAPPSHLHILRRRLQIFALCAAWLRTTMRATWRAGHVACEPLHCCALRHAAACAVRRMVRACHVV